jgi:hypothetical protein
MATWKREIKLPWRGAGPLNHLSHDEVDPDRLVGNKELSLSIAPTKNAPHTHTLRNPPAPGVRGRVFAFNKQCLTSAFP